MVKIIPAPVGSIDQPLKALILIPGSIIIREPWCLRVMDGEVTPNMMIKLMFSGREFEVLEVGVFSAETDQGEPAAAWGSGVVSARRMKELSDTKIGDTITDSKTPQGMSIKRFNRFRRWGGSW